MDNKHAHTPAAIFDLIGNTSFESLRQEQQQEVLQYFTKDAYEELHHAARLLGKGMLAGSTSAYHPSKTALLNQFDKTYAGPTLFSLASSLWKIAAVCLLFLSGWLCHYLASHSRNKGAIMAVVDTVYLAPQTVIKYDTVYIEKTGASKSHTQPMQHRMQERRDATECQPSPMKRYPTGNPGASPRKASDGDDSLSKPMNT